MIVSYNAGAVKFYNASSSLVHFENKYFHFTLKNALAYYLHTTVVLYVFENSEEHTNILITFIRRYVFLYKSNV
jgi:hypothetical protein